jgi:hypothetical protein
MLESGLERLHQQLKQTHWQVYEKIRQRFSDYFDDLVHLKDTRCDLVPVTTTFDAEGKVEEGLASDSTSIVCEADQLENGFRIVLTDALLPRCGSGSDGLRTTRVRVRGGEEEEEEERYEEGELKPEAGLGVQGLSGGQQALLGLALVFACALSSQRSPVYFLDEVGRECGRVC